MIALAAIGVAQSVSAQGWLEDRSRAEGAGIRLGDFELHPGIGVEGGYDSNLYLTQDNAVAPARHVGSAILRVSPHLYFSTLGAQRTQGQGEGSSSDEQPVVTFRGGVSAAYYEFFAAPERRNLDVNADFRLTLLPGRTVSFALYDQFSRGVRPFTENFRPDQSTARIRNTAGLDLNMQSDGGILQGLLSYKFGLSVFEGQLFSYGNSFDHTVSLQQTWRFLPNTALVTDAALYVTDYFGDISGSPVALNDNVRLRARVGLNGAITDQFSLSAMVGYGAGFFANATPTYRQDYDNLVAQLEARYQFSEGTRLTLGYDRDFQSAYLGNYVGRDRGYVAFQSLIASSFLVGVDAEVAFMDFGVIVASNGMLAGDRPSREDIRVGASIFAEYRFTSWLALNASGRYTGTFTDYQYRVPAATVFLDPASYNKFEAYLGLRVFY